MPSDIVLIVLASGPKDRQDKDSVQRNGSWRVGILVKRTCPDQAFELNSAIWADTFDNDSILPYTVLLAAYLCWMLAWLPGETQEHFSAAEGQEGGQVWPRPSLRCNNYLQKMHCIVIFLINNEGYAMYA